MAIEAHFQPGAAVIGPWGHVFQLPAATAKHIRRKSDLPWDRIAQEQAAIDAIGGLPLFDITIRANADIAVQKIVQPDPASKTSIISFDPKAILVGPGPE